MQRLAEITGRISKLQPWADQGVWVKQMNTQQSAHTHVLEPMPNLTDAAVFIVKAVLLAKLKPIRL